MGTTKYRAFSVAVNPDLPVIQLCVLDAQGCLNPRVRDAIYYQLMSAVESVTKRENKTVRDKFVGDAVVAKLVHDADTEVAE